MIHFRKKHTVIRKKLPDAVCGLGSLNTRNEYGELNIEKEARMLAVSFAGYDSEKGKDDIVYVAVNPYWELSLIHISMEASPIPIWKIGDAISTAIIQKTAAIGTAAR